MPGTYADEAEILGIGKAIGELGKGIYGVVSDWNNWEQEMDLLKRLSIENKCQINFVMFFREEEDWPKGGETLQYVKEAAKGSAINSSCRCPSGEFITQLGKYHPPIQFQSQLCRVIDYGAG